MMPSTTTGPLDPPEKAPAAAHAGGGSGSVSVDGAEQQHTALDSLAALASTIPLPSAIVPGGGRQAADAAGAGIKSEVEAARARRSDGGKEWGDDKSGGLPTPATAASFSPVLAGQQGPSSQQHGQQTATNAGSTLSVSSSSASLASGGGSHGGSHGGNGGPHRFPPPSTSSLVAALSALPPELRHFLSGEVLDGAGAIAPATAQAAAVCGVVWHDGGVAHGGLLPHVVCNDQFSTMLMSKKRVEATVLGEGLRPEHLWERCVRLGKGGRLFWGVF
jgi:hypothetical protein